MLVEETETSPGSEPAEDVAANPAPAEATTDVAESSPAAADVNEAKPKLLDVVKAVVQPQAEPEASSAAEPKTEGQAAPEEASDELTSEELETLPFGKHPRFKQVIGQRDEARQQAGELQTKLAEYEPAAQQWGLVRGFMSENQLSDTDMLDGFRMMAMVRMDPLNGRKAIVDYLDQLDTALGLKLPEDLRDDLDLGRITEERAYELSRSRAAQTAQQQEQQQRQTEQQQSQQREQVQQHVSNMTTAATAWETQVRGTDPDFDRKQQLIADRMQALVAADPKATPKNADEMTALLNRAHTDVTSALKRIVPQPRPVARPTSAANPTVAAPQPKTMREAIALAASAGT